MGRVGWSGAQDWVGVRMFRVKKKAKGLATSELPFMATRLALSKHAFGFIQRGFTLFRGHRAVGTSYQSTKFKKAQFWGFPGGAVIENLPASSGDTGSSPGPGRSHMPRGNWAHAPQLLSLCSRAHEPQLLKPLHLEPVPHNKRSHHNEKSVHHNEKWPPFATTREKTVHNNEDPMQPKNKIIK